MKKILSLFLILILLLTGCSGKKLTENKKNEEKSFDVEEKIQFIIENGPLTSSNPYDYINYSVETYDELLANPKETFEYCIRDLLESDGGRGLTSYIEAILCSNINTNFQYDFETAAEYLENYKDFLKRTYVYLNEYDKYTLSIMNQKRIIT